MSDRTVNPERAERLKLLRDELRDLAWKVARLACPSNPNSVEVTVGRRPMFERDAESKYRWTARVQVPSLGPSLGLDTADFGSTQRRALRALIEQLKKAREFMGDKNVEAKLRG